jgi:hypothetical protein
MIRIDKNNSYLSEFSRELNTYLSTKLKELIDNKFILGNKTKISDNHIENLDIYKYVDIAGVKKKQEIKCKVNTTSILCLKYLKRNIVEIINANIEKQKEFIKNIQDMYPDIKNKNSNIYKVVKCIFIDMGYESKISSAKDGEIAYKLVKKIGIDSCPYCNRNYISVVKKEEKGDSKTRPQLDHFYPKAIYPFLACSFYNLIPSCSTCNLMKSDKDSFKDELISPYELDRDSFKFSYTLNNTDILNIGIQDSSKYDYKESINIIFDKKNEINEKYFELEKLYNQEHRDIVIELLVKKAYYPQSYINELSSFGFNQDEVYRYLFSNYNKDEDLHKRPLSKLIKDISTELGLAHNTQKN